MIIFLTMLDPFFGLRLSFLVVKLLIFGFFFFLWSCYLKNYVFHNLVFCQLKGVMWRYNLFFFLWKHLFFIVVFDWYHFSLNFGVLKSKFERVVLLKFQNFNLIIKENIPYNIMIWFVIVRKFLLVQDNANLTLFVRNFEIWIIPKNSRNIY